MDEKTTVKVTTIIGGAIVIAALLHGGIFIESRISAGSSSRPCSLNKFTGHIECGVR
jgi:hypothetical protein